MGLTRPILAALAPLCSLAAIALAFGLSSPPRKVAADLSVPIGEIRKLVDLAPLVEADVTGSIGPTATPLRAVLDLGPLAIEFPTAGVTHHKVTRAVVANPPMSHRTPEIAPPNFTNSAY
jgi:hypothetical protein